MFQDLIPFLKEPYVAIIAASQWFGLGIFFAIDTKLDIVLLLSTTIASTLLMMWVVVGRNR